ncbi:MAG: hypothetical protein ACRD4X_14420 [Candidatus Acidiferrales bacterium]
MRTTMSQNQPHSLTAQAYAEILATLLPMNGAPAGRHQLMDNPSLASPTIRLEKDGRADAQP